jgi:CubicO group peptidase (beta-lactamase class C family)
MTRLARLPLALLCLLAALGACDRQTPGQRMDHIVRARAEAGRFSGAVLVARDGQVLLDQGYGMASREWDIANTPATRFRLASLSKQFTAAAILQLAERGKLALDAPLKTYFPEAPPTWDRVTVLQLLDHTSGIPDYLTAPDYAATQALPATPRQLLARFRDRPLDFAPGSQWAYSNSGYVLLGLLLEQLGGMSYGEVLQQNLLAPLGMRGSGYDDGRKLVPHLASGYRLDQGAIVPALVRHPSTLYAAGGLYSTTGDLLRWQQGLYGGKVLAAASLRRMTTPGLQQAGLGLLILPLEDHLVYVHGGGVDGVHTLMSYDPTLKTTVIVLANLQDADVATLAGELAALARGERVILRDERRERTLPAERLRRFAGRYQLAPGFDLVFTVENGQLIGQATGQQKYPASAEAPDMFFFKVNDAEVEFFGEGAAADSLVLHQNGQYFKARRQPGS